MKSFGHLFWVCNPAIEIREERQQLLQGSKEDKKKKKKKKSSDFVDSYYFCWPENFEYYLFCIIFFQVRVTFGCIEAFEFEWFSL